MNAVFVDTNVLLYSEDACDAAKQARAVALWFRRLGRLSTQINPFLIGPELLDAA